MFIAIVERAVVPHLTEDMVKVWRDRWHKKPLHCILSTPAFPDSRMMKTFNQTVLGKDQEIAALGLMPPTNREGEWQKTMSTKCAGMLIAYLLHNKPDGIFLVGSKVTHAITRRKGTVAGELYIMSGLRMISVPKPGDRRHNIERQLREFYDVCLREPVREESSTQPGDSGASGRNTQ